MTAINLADETFISSTPAAVARAVAQPDRWRRWFPALVLSVYEDRGVKGVRWTVAGEFVGSAELWVEPHLDGVVLHHFLRIDPSSQLRAGRIRRTERRFAMSWKRHVWELKDELEEAGRV